MKRRAFLAGASTLAAGVALGVSGDSAATTRRHRIAVVGCGPMGSAAARHLAESGEDVLVVGPDEPADAARHDGPFASHYDEGRQAEYAAHSVDLSRLARASTDNYRALETRTKIRSTTIIRI